jgi:lysophospholipase L1-like esterase
MASANRLARLRRRAAVAILAALVCGELFARYYLGLGDPPLSQTHPTIEYLFKPNQVAHPFGNVFRTNRYGMRSDDFPPQKIDPHELRIMVYGDSIINGGNLTDQSRVGTSVLQRALAKTLQRPVVVGNISAGSWGPPNELAYLRQYGFLDADVMILVLSSSDYDDAPTFEPLNPLTHPTVAPVSALWDGFTRYLPRLWNGQAVNESGVVSDPERVPNLRDIEVSLSAARDFLEMSKSHPVRILLVQHWSATELRTRKPERGYWEIRRVAAEAGVAVYEDADRLRASLDAGKNPYRDDEHLNEYGQQALADLLFDALTKDFQMTSITR